MNPNEANSILQLYGLDQILSDQDDPQLWAIVLSESWTSPNNSKINVASLRFGIGRVALKTELKIQPFEAWGFEQVDFNRLRPKSYPVSPYTDADFDKTLHNSIKSILFYLPFVNTEYPRLSLVLTRPSKGEKEVLVFSGAQYAHNFGYGETCVWLYQSSGIWQKAEKPLKWWRS